MNTIHSWGKLIIALVLLIAVSVLSIKGEQIPGSLLGIVTGVMIIQSLVIFEYEGGRTK